MEWKPSLSIGHHLVSVSLCFSGPHLYRSVIILSVSVCVFLDRTYIDRSFICQFQFSFSGPHLYQSIIILSVSVCVHLKSGPHPYRSVIYRFFSLSFRGLTYIDRPFSYQFVFILSRDRTYIDRSFIVFSA